jgi:hypothetical protein
LTTLTTREAWTKDKGRKPKGKLTVKDDEIQVQIESSNPQFAADKIRSKREPTRSKETEGVKESTVKEKELNLLLLRNSPPQMETSKHYCAAEKNRSRMVTQQIKRGHETIHDCNKGY